MTLQEARIQRQCARWVRVAVAVLLAGSMLALAACSKGTLGGAAGGNNNGGGNGSGAKPFGGPGPWPLDNRVHGAAQGILESPVIGASTDEAQNLWVATHAALYLLKPGEARFRRIAAADGLHLQSNPVRYCDSWAPDHACPILGAAADPGITEIAGGAAGEVFVGYAGNTDGSGDYTDPNRHTGALDRVRLNGDGTLKIDRLQMVSGTSAEFWHNRTVTRLLYDHFAHPHELYVGTNHGVDRMQPDKLREPKAGEWFNDVNKEWMADHLHPRVCFHAPCASDESNQRTGDWRGLALDGNGDLWVAGRWTAGQIKWTSNLVDWFSRPGAAAFGIAFGDPYPQAANADGFVNEPVFRPPREGDPVALSATAVGKDGRVWFASGPAYTVDPAYGVAVWDGHKFTVLDPQKDLGLGERFVRDLAALPDGRIVLAGATTGLSIFDPATGRSTAIRGSALLPSDKVLRIEVDRMVDPPAILVSTDAGVAVLRKF